jgi:hypothetical protein
MKTRNERLSEIEEMKKAEKLIFIKKVKFHNEKVNSTNTLLDEIDIILSDFIGKKVLLANADKSKDFDKKIIELREKLNLRFWIKSISYTHYSEICIEISESVSLNYDKNGVCSNGCYYFTQHLRIGNVKNGILTEKITPNKILLTSVKEQTELKKKLRLTTEKINTLNSEKYRIERKLI